MKYLKFIAPDHDAKQSKSLNDRIKDNTTKNYGALPYILAFIASALFPFTWLYVNENNFSVAETTIVRGFASVFVNIITCMLTNSSMDSKDPQTFKFLTIRSMIVTVYSMTVTISQFILPLPVVHTINNSGVIFVFIIDYFMNGVKINQKQAVGIFLGILGVLITGSSQLVTELIFGGEGDGGAASQKKGFNYYITEDPYYRSLFALYYIFVILFRSYGMVLTKKIKANTYQINFNLGIFLQMVGTIIYPFCSINQNFTVSKKIERFVLSTLLMGIPLVFCQIIFIAAVTMTENTGILNMIGFSSILFSYLLSIFRYHELPNVVTITGIVLLVFGMYRTIFGKDKGR